VRVWEWPPKVVPTLLFWVEIVACLGDTDKAQPSGLTKTSSTKESPEPATAFPAFCLGLRKFARESAKILDYATNLTGYPI
jgi:hypothetical protein